MKWVLLISAVAYAGVIMPVNGQPNTFALRVKVMDKHDKILSNFTVIVNGQTIKTNFAGEFEIGINNAKSYVSVDIEQGKYSILYPRQGRLVIPKDLSERAAIVVDINSDYNSNNKLDKLLKNDSKQQAYQASISAKQDSIIESQRAANQLITSSIQIQQQARIKENREKYSGNIVEGFSVFLSKANYLSVLLKHTPSSLVGEPATTKALMKAIEEYNAVHAKLKGDRSQFEKIIENYWQNDSLKINFNINTLYATDTLNNTILEKLNPILDEIREYSFLRKNTKKRNEQIEKTIKQNIDSALPPLNVMIAEMDRRNRSFEVAINK